MGFASALVELIISRSWDLLKKPVGYISNAKTCVESMMASMEDLIARRDDVVGEIEDASREQKESTKVVERWLDKVKEIVREGVKVGTQFEQTRCLFGCCSLNLFAAWKAGEKSERLLVELEKLKLERDSFGVITKTKVRGRGHAMPTQSALIGVDGYVEKVRGYLADDSVGVIGIYGTGGVGKTTMLKKVNNSLLEDGNMGFEYLIWLVVSKEFRLEKLQAGIAEILGLKLNENDDAKKHADVIYNFLKDRSFVLFLDDLWRGFDLVDVGIPDIHVSRNFASSSTDPPKKLQKVILTTRSKKACGSMHPEATMNVECLKRDDARSLFKEYVGEWNLKSNLSLQSLVDQVADKCAGLPLALTVIGKAMSTKTTRREWQKALISLERSRASEILDEDDSMLPTLMYSYDNLKNDALQKCFLYCSLWPEDHDIYKEDIIAYLIGLGVIKDFSDITEAYDEGHCIMEDLKTACLLESGSDDRVHVKMHDILRDMALWIASDCGKNQHKWLVKVGRGLRAEHWEAGVLSEVEVVSLMHNKLEELPIISFECPKLLTLMLQRNISLQRIHPNIFQYTPALVCLDLSKTDIKELPPSIGTLKMLQYLNLAFTAITSLPKELGSLKRLWYLDLHGTRNLKDIPSGLISSLLGLRLLNLFSSGACTSLNVGCLVENTGDVDDGSDGRRPSPIDEMESLPGGMKGLGIHVASTEFLRRLSMLSRVSMWRLYLTRLQGLVTLSLHRSLWQCLQQLSMESCKDVEVLEIGVGAEGRNDSSPVEILWMTNFWKLKEIIWRGAAPRVFFQRLSKVKINKCHLLKDISWVLQLPSLVMLDLSSCQEIECVIADNAGEEANLASSTAFPSLKHLSLSDLLNLSSICGLQYGFPALENLEVDDCPMLKKLPLRANNSSKLQKIRCPEDWWDALQWDEQETKKQLECSLQFSKRSRTIRTQRVSKNLGIETIGITYTV